MHRVLCDTSTQRHAYALNGTFSAAPKQIWPDALSSTISDSNGEFGEIGN